MEKTEIREMVKAVFDTAKELGLKHISFVKMEDTKMYFCNDKQKQYRALGDSEWSLSDNKEFLILRPMLNVLLDNVKYLDCFSIEAGVGLIFARFNEPDIYESYSYETDTWRNDNDN